MKETGTITIDVPYGHCDPSGFVHHPHFLEYAEQGRIALLAENGVTIDKAKEWGYLIATGSVTLKCLEPVRYGDRIRIQTKVEHINSARIKTKTTISLYLGNIDSDSGSGSIVVWDSFPAAEIETTSVFLGEDLKPKRLPREAFDGDWSPEVMTAAVAMRKFNAVAVGEPEK